VKKKCFKMLLALLLLVLTTQALAMAVYSSAELEYLTKFNELTGSNFSQATMLTREDFCVAVAKVFVGEQGATSLPFADIGEIKSESLPWLAALYERGILSGSLEYGELYMYPGANITRQEAIAILGRILGETSSTPLSFSDSDDVADWARPYIAWFAERGIVTGYPNGALGAVDTMTAAHLAALTMETVYFQRGGAAVTTIYGTGSHGLVDGNATVAKFTSPQGIAIGSDEIYIFDTNNNAIRHISATGVRTLVGRADYIDSNGLPAGYYVDSEVNTALLNRPTSGVIAADGTLYFADSQNNTIRMLRNNRVTTFSGTGEAGHTDGAASAALFNSPMSIAMDNAGNIYVADTLNEVIRKIDTSGNATTIAGTAGKSGFQDGAALSALFRSPSGIAVSGDGTVIFVADTGNHLIRKIENGAVSTLAGRIGETDSDGEPIGSSELFNLPKGLTLAEDILVVADSANHRICAVTMSGDVAVIAGTGEPGSADGVLAQLNAPADVAYHDGVLYIVDTGNNQIRVMSFEIGGE